MASAALTRAHMQAQRHLAAIVGASIAATWRGLGHYDRVDIDAWLASALPLVRGGQQQSAALTSAFIARSLKIPTFAIDPSMVTGAAVRNGADMTDVYSRPFYRTWKQLSDGKPWQAAVDSGQSLAESTSATDLALTSRASFGEAHADPAVPTALWRRVWDGRECGRGFCESVNGAICLSPDASPLHENCGCSLEPVDSAPEGASVLPAGTPDAGELGTVFA